MVKHGSTICLLSMTSRMLLRHRLLAPLDSLLAPGIRFGQTCQPQLHIHHMLLLHPVCGQSRHRQMLPRLSKHTVLLPNHQHLLRTTTKPNMRMLLQMRPRRLMCARSKQQLHLNTGWWMGASGIIDARVMYYTRDQNLSEGSKHELAVKRCNWALDRHACEFKVTGQVATHAFVHIVGGRWPDGSRLC